MKLDVRRLDEIREWVLHHEAPREAGLLIFSWSIGICSAAGFRIRELIEILGGRKDAPEVTPVAPRSLSEVIDRMLALVPEPETRLREYLGWAKTNVAFKAPEELFVCWEGVSTALYQRFSTPPKDGWGKQVIDIFVGSP